MTEQANCNHIIAIYPDLNKVRITKDNIHDVAERWVRDAQYFNRNTKRLQITPPAQLETANFCTMCGFKLDRAANEKIINDTIDRLGGLS
ncbi:hypothetical protein [Photobacterium leiognathi]|uniref:hypothetical protein n=1 Tax=Photobacterium leiognathi TaxID=553611 RepID=UPI002981E18C|nr:hypothetical protein [Photobacterium leiognathi]